MEIRHLICLFACLQNFRETLGFELILNFTYRELLSIPEELSPNATAIWLWTNQISTIHNSDFFNCPILTFINLNNNRIASIDHGCFKGTRLLTIYLNGNRLSVFPDFSEVNSTLRNIYLYSNQITKISRDDIQYLNIATLNLIQNPLVQFPDFSHFFPTMSNLFISGIKVQCCYNIAWLKRKPPSQLRIDDAPCGHPIKWSTTNWIDISEEMLLTQSCGETILTIFDY